MIGTTAALIGLTAATAGSKVAEAAMGAHAAGKAAKTQSAAVDKSMDLQRQIWGQQQQMQQPYLHAGSNSMNLLGSLMTPQGMPGAYRPPPGMGSSGYPNPNGPMTRPPMSFGMPPPGAGGPPPMGGPPPGMPPGQGQPPWAFMQQPRSFMMG
jgi:hypothetical protein